MIYRGHLSRWTETLPTGGEPAGLAGGTAMQIGRLSSLVFYALSYGEFGEAKTTLSRMQVLLEVLTEPSMAEERFLYSEMWYQGLSGEWGGMHSASAGTAGILAGARR
jgi:hypothetical protein